MDFMSHVGHVTLHSVSWHVWKFDTHSVILLVHYDDFLGQKKTQTIASYMFHDALHARVHVCLLHMKHTAESLCKQ